MQQSLAGSSDARRRWSKSGVILETSWLRLPQKSAQEHLGSYPEQELSGVRCPMPPVVLVRVPHHEAPQRWRSVVI